MARKRMISPTIWEDPSFNKLEFGARLLFIGMFSNADDQGYIRADTGSLKRLIFGFDDEIMSDLLQWVNTVKKMRSIHFYESKEELYAHFIKWDFYQKQREDRIQASSYPYCTTCPSFDGQVSDKRGHLPAEVSSGSSVKECEGSTPPSVGGDAPSPPQKKRRLPEVMQF